MKWPGKYITHPWDMTEQLIWDASVGALAPEKQATQPVGWHSAYSLFWSHFRHPGRSHQVCDLLPCLVLVGRPLNSAEQNVNMRNRLTDSLFFFSFNYCGFKSC